MGYNHFTSSTQLAEKYKLLISTHYFTCSESDNLQSLMERMGNVSAIAFIALDGNNSDFSFNDSERLTKRPQYFFWIPISTPHQTSMVLF